MVDGVRLVYMTRANPDILNSDFAQCAQPIRARKVTTRPIKMRRRFDQVKIAARD